MEWFSKPKTLVLNDCSPVLPDNKRHGGDNKNFSSVDKKMLIFFAFILSPKGDKIIQPSI